MVLVFYVLVCFGFLCFGLVCFVCSRMSNSMAKRAEDYDFDNEDFSDDEEVLVFSFKWSVLNVDFLKK